MIFELREILDAVKAKIDTSPALHYLFAPKGELATQFSLAAKDCPDEASQLWCEFINCVKTIHKKFKYQRIADGIAILENASPFRADALNEGLAAVSLELSLQENLDQAKRHRVSGRSCFEGRKVGRDIFVPTGSHMLMVESLKGQDIYKFTANKAWTLVDRVLRIVNRGERDFVIPINSTELNTIKDSDAFKFFDKYVLRADLPVDERTSHRQTKRNVARFLYEKLRTPLK